MTKENNPDLFDVAKMVQKGWNQVNNMTICRCLNKLAVSLRPMSNELNATYRQMKNKSKSDNIKCIVNQLSKLSLVVDRQNPVNVQLQETITEKDLNHWLRLEKQEKIMDMLVQDNCNFIGRDAENDLEAEERVDNVSEEKCPNERTFSSSSNSHEAT